MKYLRTLIACGTRHICGLRKLWPLGSGNSGLTSQHRRAGVSIPANIAEGCGRRTDDDFARSLDDALGSASEVEYPLLLAHDLGFLGLDAHDHLDAQTTEVKRVLASLLGRLRSDG